MDSFVREGEVLAGKYRVERVLGVGGMGVVVAAYHLELDAKVALKFLLPETLSNAEAVARFAREARAAVKIKSEHVARVSDVGKLESGAPYMVMEYLEGLDLSGWLSQRGVLPVEQAVELVLQASEAIAEAHSLGIVHRDLKPANLFVVRRPDGGLSIKVLDFGISKTTSLSGSGGEGSMTKTTTMLGSPLYMSPEHIQSSRNVDARTDTWALGVILYELVTGHTPFGGEHIAELMFNIISSPPTPMRNYRADLPDGFEQVIFRCLEKRRESRFSSIGELAMALSRFAPPRSAVSVERIAGVVTTTIPGAVAAHVASGPSVVRVHQTGSSHSPAGTQAAWGQTSSAKTRTGTWLAFGSLGATTALVAGFVFAKASSHRGEGARAASVNVAATASASIASPEAPKPDHTSPSASSTSSAVAPTPPVSLPVSSSAPDASARPRSLPLVKPKQSPVATSAPPRDPWGGTQH